MLKGIVKKIFGDKNLQDQKKFQPFVDAAKTFEEKLKSQSDNELRDNTAAFKARVAAHIAPLEQKQVELKMQSESEDDLHEKEGIFEKIDELDKEIDVEIEAILLEILPEAFAVVKETSRRWAENGQLVVTATALDMTLAAQKDGITIDGENAIWHNQWNAAGNLVNWTMVHYDVQLMGGAVLHKGNIAEMQTGEGKTLVATLPVYLNALTGKGVHVVTVNDYLAKRDSQWMGPLYQFHGLTVGCIDNHQPNSPSRKEAYLSDITFGTNNEFGFDYLRDNMASEVSDLVQRKHHYAIIDEVDSVLIDDARTPLIISGPTPRGDQHEFNELKPLIENLIEEQKKFVNQALADAKRLLTVINDPAIDDKKDLKSALDEGGIALLRAYRGLPKNRALIKFLSEPGLKTHLLKTENVYMAEQNKRMPEIDSELFFTIDEKQNSIDLTTRGLNLIAGNRDSEFFVLPDLSISLNNLKNEGLDQDTYMVKKDAIIRDYSIKSDRIHSISQLLKAYALFEKEVEYVIMDGKVKIVDEQTGRIMEGRRYSDGLHQAIEAKENVTIEAASQTYATITLQNYFRMYHKISGMTGTAETEAKEFWDIYKLDVVVVPTHRAISRRDLNDQIYKSSREKYNAIINEVERLSIAGRPVLVGTTTVEISELLSRMLKMKGVNHQVLNAKYHQKEAEIVADAGKSGAVTIATNMAGRGTDIKLGEGVKELGGLAIVGTERHESRRVDRQLRGRAGRQGDPGTSQFYVSLEDDLMRRFGYDRTAKMMDRIGMKEGEVISSGLVSKSIERAQKNMEENNFGSRKHLLEYDDVMNAQRKAIYKKRRNALFGDRLSIDVANSIYEVANNIVMSNMPFDDYELELLRVLGVQSPVDAATYDKINRPELSEQIYDLALAHYARKNDRIIGLIQPQVIDVVNDEKLSFENMTIPLSDGKQETTMIVSLKEAYESNGKTIITAIERNIVLSTLDNEWKEHLREMDDLKTSVRQATYEQKDPLLIYKLESYELFKSLVGRINNETMDFLIKIEIAREEIKTTNKQVTQQNSYGNASSQQFPQEELSQSNSGRDYYEEGLQRQEQTRTPITVDPKINRNEACPCGSGKKYKQCHGA